MTVVSAEGAALDGPRRRAPTRQASRCRQTDRKAELRQQALADSGVQAMLDVFAAEIKDVEER